MYWLVATIRFITKICEYVATGETNTLDRKKKGVAELNARSCHENNEKTYLLDKRGVGGLNVDDDNP